MEKQFLFWHNLQQHLLIHYDREQNQNCQKHTLRWVLIIQNIGLFKETKQCSQLNDRQRKLDTRNLFLILAECVHECRVNQKREDPMNNRIRQRNKMCWLHLINLQGIHLNKQIVQLIWRIYAHLSCNPVAAVLVAYVLNFNIEFI